MLCHLFLNCRVSMDQDKFPIEELWWRTLIICVSVISQLYIYNATIRLVGGGGILDRQNEQPLSKYLQTLSPDEVGNFDKPKAVVFGFWSMIVPLGHSGPFGG